MQKIDYLDAQSQLAKTMRQVCEKDTPVTINGAGKDQVVMMPLETFQRLRRLGLDNNSPLRCNTLKQRRRPEPA